MNDTSALDKAVIDTLKGLMKDRFGFLIETFISKTHTHLEELDTAIAANNVDSIISITHSLKGSAGSVGALSMHLLCKEYEDRSRQNDLSDVQNWVEKLRIEYDRYNNEIKTYL